MFWPGPDVPGRKGQSRFRFSRIERGDGVQPSLQARVDVVRNKRTALKKRLRVSRFDEADASPGKVSALQASLIVMGLYLGPAAGNTFWQDGLGVGSGEVESQEVSCRCRKSQ